MRSLGWQPRISLRAGLAGTYQEFLVATSAAGKDAPSRASRPQ
jgi:hypothetical protein